VPAACSCRAEHGGVSEQKDRMLRGELYLAGDPELRADAARCDALLARFNATRATDLDERRRILTELLGDLGEGAVIRPPVFMDYGYQTSVGSGTFINFNCVILDVGRVRIGADVQIGPNVQILTPTHPIDPEQRRSGLEAAKPITIEDNVWLGGGAIVLAGVTIGRDTVVGAAAVVTKDLPPGVVAVGNPARVIRPV
jgi:maltose O-acetyltransferase